MSPHKHTRKPINGQCSRSQASVDITQGASSSGSPMSKDGASKTGKKGRRRRKESGPRRGPGHISLHVTIDALPDNVLLDIFEFYREISYSWEWPWPWNRLVHVCQRWRYLVFGSPLRLDLRLRCTSDTPVRETLDFWPPLPIEILLDVDHFKDVDNIIAALEHRDRVRCIRIYNPTSSELERLAPMMQEPFPALISLQLDLRTHGATPALPDMFLGGSAQRLQSLRLSGIPFPRFPRFLLSAPNLSELTLEGIPHTGYISPEAMVTGLSALIRLTYLVIEFESPASRPGRRDQLPPPLTRVVLPVLTGLVLKGVSEYLEDLVARIDAPQLKSLNISFFNQVIFDIQQLPCFIGRTEKLRSFNHASVSIASHGVQIHLNSSERANPLEEFMSLGILCRAVDWQVWSMAQICNQILFLLSIVEQLHIQFDHLGWEPTWQVDMEDTQWLALFRLFTAVRTLWISRELQSLVVPALQGLTGERATEVLPALDSLYLEEYQPSGPDQQAIEPFIAARQYSDHPVAVHRWER